MTEEPPPLRRLDANAPVLCETCPLPPHTPFRCLWLTLTSEHGLHLPVPKAWLLLFMLAFIGGTLSGAAVMGAWTVSLAASVTR